MKINLEKSEIILMGKIVRIEVLAQEFSIKDGPLDLVFSLDSPFTFISIWDGVKEKLQRRLAVWKRQYLSKGGRLAMIPTLSLLIHVVVSDF